MSRLFEKRKKAILDVCEDWAYKEKGTYFISFWDLAGHLNNCWYAPLFVNKKLLVPVYKKLLTPPQYAGSVVNDYEEYEMKRAIDWTVKRMKGKIIQQTYATFYRIKIPKK